MDLDGLDKYFEWISKFIDMLFDKGYMTYIFIGVAVVALLVVMNLIFG
jgi:hypothetical protein